MKSTLETYIRKRLICFKHTHGLICFHVLHGCKQRSCLGPFILPLVADRILKHRKQRNLLTVSYVKDSVMSEVADTHSALERKSNTNVQHSSISCSGHLLQISAEKSGSVLFGSNTLNKKRPQMYQSKWQYSLFCFFFLDSTIRKMGHLDMIWANPNDFTCKIRNTHEIRMSNLNKNYIKIILKSTSTSVVCLKTLSSTSFTFDWLRIFYLDRVIQL